MKWVPCSMLKALSVNLRKHTNEMTIFSKLSSGNSPSATWSYYKQFAVVIYILDEFSNMEKEIWFNQFCYKCGSYPVLEKFSPNFGQIKAFWCALSLQHNWLKIICLWIVEAIEKNQYKYIVNMRTGSLLIIVQQTNAPEAKVCLHKKNSHWKFICSKQPISRLNIFTPKNILSSCKAESFPHSKFLKRTQLTGIWLIIRFL